MLVDGFKGLGYGRSTSDELQFAVEASRTTGVLLDPVYTTKAARGTMEVLNTPEFDGRTAVFVHTGGMPGLLGHDVSTLPL